MSTFVEKEVVCALCGKVSVQEEFGSCSIFGEPDLDFRPPKMLRFTMKAWVQECPHCGYAADEIKIKPRMKKALLMQLYEDAKWPDTLPRWALSFVKYALYLERKKDMAGSINNYMCAVWICDDEKDEPDANMLRIRCLGLVNQLLPKCHTKRKRRKYLLLKADLLRRVGYIDLLRQIRVDDPSFDYTSREIILYQKELAERHDYAAHSQDELDLNEFDDFFEKKKSTREDCYIRIQECIRRTLSWDNIVRDEALSQLDELRPKSLNAPYRNIDEIIYNHKGRPVYDGIPLGVEHLAPLVNAEIIELLESLVVSSDTYREKVTEENIFAMALLHELYKSPYLNDEYKEYAKLQEHRLYIMYIDRDDDDSCNNYLALIEPRLST